MGIFRSTTAWPVAFSVVIRLKGGKRVEWSQVGQRDLEAFTKLYNRRSGALRITVQGAHMMLDVSQVESYHVKEHQQWNEDKL